MAVPLRTILSPRCQSDIVYSLSAAILCSSVCVSDVINKAGMCGRNIKHVTSHPFCCCCVSLAKSKPIWLSPKERKSDDDDVELNVLGCRVDILGTNCDQCISMVQCCFTSTETIRLIRTGGPGRPPRLSHSS